MQCGVGKGHQLIWGTKMVASWVRPCQGSKLQPSTAAVAVAARCKDPVVSL